MTTPEAVGTTKLYIGNLDSKWSETDLLEAFNQFGTIGDTKIIRRDGRSMGFGFIGFVNEADAKKAIEAMDNQDMKGRIVKVSLCEKRN